MALLFTSRIIESHREAQVVRGVLKLSELCDVLGPVQLSWYSRIPVYSNMTGVQPQCMVTASDHNNSREIFSLLRILM